jgi:hypothetical protein
MRTMTALERQRSRDDLSLTNELALLDHAKRQRQVQTYDRANGPNAALDALARAFDAHRRLAGKGVVGAAGEALADAQREIGQVVTARNLRTGEAVEQRDFYLCLIDRMFNAGQLERDLYNAADAYRTLFWQSAGGSRGVAAYGDFVQAAPASQRMLVSQKQMKLATVAAFGTLSKEGRWVLDAALMHLVIPAIIDDSKDVSQTWIGNLRTTYKGPQLPAAGATVLREVLQRLALHLCMRNRADRRRS